MDGFEKSVWHNLCCIWRHEAVGWRPLMCRRKKRSQLLEDLMRAMCIEVRQSIQSHDISQIYKTMSKWDTLFRELIAPMVNGKGK